jgi:hypothetical protein
MRKTKRVGHLSAPVKRPEIRSRHSARPSPKRTGFDVTEALMAHRFSPVVCEDSKCLVDWQKKERGVFASLSHLSKLYGFAPIEKSEFPYPQNVVLALQDATDRVQSIFPDAETCILSDKKHPAVIGTFSSISPEHDLYYISVAPFAAILRTKTLKEECNLLYSIFSYLHRVVGMDYFADKRSYLFMVYTRLQECEVECFEEEVEDEEDGEDFEPELVAEIDFVLDVGKAIWKEMCKALHLKQFTRRVKSFQPKDEAGSELHRLAQMASELLIQYPGRSIVDSIPHAFKYPYDEYWDQGPLRSFHWLSFMWDDTGELGKMVIEYVNSDLENHVGRDEPLRLQVFDGPQSVPTIDIDFEKRIISLIEELCYFLKVKIWKG